MKKTLHLLAFALLFSLAANAQETYKRPPNAVLDVLSASAPPSVVGSPTRDKMILAEAVRYPSIADLSQPYLSLAGLRVNPNTNAPHRQQTFVNLRIKNIADGKETAIELPKDSRASIPSISQDGRLFAFMNTTPTGVELYVGEMSNGRTRRVENLKVNAAYGQPMRWMPDAKTLLVQAVPLERGAVPRAAGAPTGPNVQESSGKGAPIRTFQDLLKTPHDEGLFEYYATSNLAFVDATNGQVANRLKTAGIYQTAQPAPDGEHILVAKLKRPFSFLYPHWAFPKTVEVINRKGETIYQLADLPLAEPPIDGVPVGARSYDWRPDQPATLVWAEALDGGDPKRKVPHRDKVLMLAAPFKAAPIEMTKTVDRFAGIDFLENGNRAMVRDFNRDTRFVRTSLLLVKDIAPAEARELFNLSAQDRYADPGAPLQRRLPNGHSAIQVFQNKYVYLSGQGATQTGDRPFLDRFDLEAKKAERLFRADEQNFESFVALLKDDASEIITRRENPTEPPNIWKWTLIPPDKQYIASPTISGIDPKKEIKDRFGNKAVPLTNFPDPAPQLRGIKKQLVTYKRADGVPLSFTLYLPPNYKEGTRLPTIVWAYPLEFNDAGTAGQVTGSTNRFTLIGGISHLFFLLNGYAVLDNTAMPVVGSVEKANDTFIEQISQSAKAAIDKAVEMGVTDPERVGVGGHSYGAFMTANLLAHTDLFRAGIARSGAYNRTLTPFGFQGERRTYWEAGDVYTKLSPFTFAHKINEPVLLIHGEADDNSGTFPVQSERLYQAIRGNGGTVRYVTLPAEAHGYTAKESVEHTIYEMLQWFDKHVKNAKPRGDAKTVAVQTAP
ncbi:MAG: prolyl oligopeptidase family serine peptidase [Pyrinomonadaceae bacterium MAG19_C2-C3]|nr:prolyl oligopeptidase family serine peptidase [Pyrinomonadaceae bacterium MAG19_C2-C3]